MKNKQMDLPGHEQPMRAEGPFQRLAENARDMVYRLSLPEARFEYVSPGCEELTGHPPKTFYESLRTIRELVHPDSEARFKEHWEALQQGHVPDFYEYCIRDATGKTRWLHQRATLILDEHGQAVALEGIVRDVTDLKLAHQALEDHRRKLTALASRLTLAEEHVRRRVAQDLHDGVAQTLIAAHMHLSQLSGQFGSEIEESLAIVSGHITSAVEDCRCIALDLSSPMLHEHGLGQAIAVMADRNSRRLGIECKLDLVEGDLGLSEELRIALFQTVRELLANVEKHSQATAISIRLCVEPNLVRIEFTDNGVGCEGPHRATTPPEGGGFGLFAIREHIGFLGGTFSIAFAPGDGCEVIVTAPRTTD